jgi:RNA polymerase sigma-70 factor, ECF subfamily
LPERDLAPRFRERLRVFAARRLGDAMLAEDVAQEALRRTIAALREGKVQDPAALPGFVFRTATHLCLHHFRARGREARALTRLAVAAEAGVDGPDPLAALVGEEARAEVRRALAALDPDDRALLTSLYFDRVDPGELARRLGVTPGALRVRKHRAHARLAGLLGDWRI